MPLIFASSSLSAIILIEPQRSVGDVPTAVKNLLLATKQLQVALRQWSIQQASETEVSDTYVTVGTEFNETVKAFAQHKIDLRFVLIVSSHARHRMALTPMCVLAKSTQYQETCEKCWNSVWGKIQHRRYSQRICQKCGKYCMSFSKGCGQSRKHGGS